MNGTISIDVATGRVSISATPGTSEEAVRLASILGRVADLLGDPRCFPALSPKVGPEFVLAEAACAWAESPSRPGVLSPSDLALVEAVQTYQESPPCPPL